MTDLDYLRDRGKVRFLTFFDMIFSLFLFGFYLIAGVVLNTYIFQVSKGPFSKIFLLIISLLLWTLAFGVTYLQMSSSYRLFLVTFQDSLGTDAASQRSLSWLRTAIFILGFVAFKVIYCHLRYPDPIWYLWTISGMEVIFRLIGMYFVREFCDDLKHHMRISNTASQTPKIVKPSDDSDNSTVPISNHVQCV